MAFVLMAALRRWYLVLVDRIVRWGRLDRRGDYFTRHLDEIAAVVRGDADQNTLRRLAFERMTPPSSMRNAGSTLQRLGPSKTP